jgi:polysaccharide pyruvyl transferase WcaK-like protein
MCIRDRQHHGIENVELMHDAAFVMDVKSIEDDGKKYIGFNLSPLSLNYSSDKGTVKQATYNMIDYIIESTDYDIKLIPHVLDETRPDTQFDPGVLVPLYEKYKDTNRVYYVDTTKLSAEEVKGEIKSCKAFIGARTHATIAAYSTLVPTTVIGYSVKSRGIAKDLFGTDNEYVIPVGDVQENTLVEAVKRLIEKNNELRDYLVDKMPEYKELAYSAGKSLKDIING